MIQLAAAAALSWLALAGPGPVPPAQAGVADTAGPLPAALPADRAPGARSAGLRLQAEDRWFAQDKLLHFTASFGGFNLAYGALRTAQLGREPAMIGAAAIAGVAGVWKEWRDRRRGGPFSARDLAWDVIGIAAGVAVAANTR
ncbi:MAG: hypothetical protein DIU52_002535 [bacterium]|jgi:uncharacterized protein YfiM (DUF2279 family)|nr:MAG: hypothetical protein DIU52_06270 [bacterium]